MIMSFVHSFNWVNSSPPPLIYNCWVSFNCPPSGTVVPSWMKFILSEGEGMDGTVVHACVISVPILLNLHEESWVCMHELLNWHLKCTDDVLLSNNSLCGVACVVWVVLCKCLVLECRLAFWFWLVLLTYVGSCDHHPAVSFAAHCTAYLHNFYAHLPTCRLPFQNGV